MQSLCKTVGLIEYSTEFYVRYVPVHTANSQIRDTVLSHNIFYGTLAQIETTIPKCILKYTL